ncbi:unnamed protein product [Brassica oleracea var. botrytis]|uniref:(rape) hypothetical protein n=1 Tax=Brassica napus TaxID=3708 RepID=A0A078FYK8_BRANA|nr:unnamed protein product [Brassica napus]CDY18056.1 BnaC07g04140D [Brassica napus]
MHALKDKVSQKLSNPFADSASSPGYSLTDSPKARFKFSGKTFSSYFPFGVRQSGNENEEEESESCPPKHGNGKHQAATMISSGQDKDSELHVSVKVESDYNEGGSTLKHGISLRTLLRRSADLPGPCLLVCLLACLFDTFLRQSYGSSPCTFLMIPKQLNLFINLGAGANRYYYMCMNELLAFGGGGSFALCLDEDLLKATSGPSETFGNECLASSTEFELKNVELWGFAHASQYLFS